jgi:PAS domain S-box-containing protein
VNSYSQSQSRDMHVLRGNRSMIKGRSVMADRLRAHDVPASALDPVEYWPAERTAVVNLLLTSPFPSALLLGPELLLIHNDAFSALPGTPEDSVPGMPFRDAWPEVWPSVGCQMLNVMESSETTLLENVRLPVARGGKCGEFYVTCSLSPYYENDAIAGVYLAMRDTTDAVLAARELRESEHRSKRILQSIGDAVIVTDAEAHVALMNPVAEKLTGWTQDNARGRLLAEVFPIVSEETRMPGANPAEAVKQSKRVVGLANRTVLVRRDKSETHIDDSAAPIFDDDGVMSGIVLVFRDINEKRAAEQERERIARELESKYNELRAIYDTSNIAMAMIDPIDFRYLRGNPKLAEILNQPMEQVVGSPVFDLASDVYGLRDALTLAASGVAVHGKIIEGELANTPGIKRHWQVEYVPVCAADGTVSVIVATSAEITAVKQMEKALIQGEKLAIVGRLTALIAHEINNPLECVMNLLYLARTSNSVADIHPFLDIAEHELRRVSAITNQSLRFYKQSSHPTSAGCEELIEGVVTIYTSRLANAQIVVEKRNRASAPVLCFEGEIRQVLNNLIGNAIDAMAPRGGRLVLRSREATNWRAGSKGLMFTVADTATGIPPQTLRRIFEPFFTTKGTFGTGLGLWVSHEIAERHRGSLRVRSSQKIGRSGTVFTLFLPFDAVNRCSSS